MNVHKSTYWRRNRLMHRNSGIHWTHPDSFGIFTKLNTSMCAADCSQGYKFTICFTPHPCSHSLLQRQLNNSGKSGASTSQVVRLVLLCALLHGWVIAVSSRQRRKSTARGKGSGRAAFPGYILQSMPVFAALSHLHLISIAVEWCAGATQWQQLWNEAERAGGRGREGGTGVAAVVWDESGGEECERMLCGHTAAGVTRITARGCSGLPFNSPQACLINPQPHFQSRNRLKTTENMKQTHTRHAFCAHSVSLKTAAAAAAAGDDLMCLSCTLGCPSCDAACLTSQQFTLQGNLHKRAAQHFSQPDVTWLLDAYMQEKEFFWG